MNPFTYQFFLSAIHSYNDKMLMYFIDEAVGIYCNLTGKAVGPRPASPKDYNAEYADAYEVANYAVFIVACKMGSYNPQEEFRPYLRKALENAIKDILKEDGEGDFFNKTAHRKKKRDEEPEQHQRVNIDSFNSPDRESPEPDSEASERAGRIMKHSNDALEAMIKFVDSLPEMKRAALYASAFGQALRPDLENYGRNYADILAGIYNTTAIYIRKLAAQGKKAALAEVRRQGFSESSMAEVSMGFIQVGPPVQDINDKVLKAVSELDSYQQFMFLRHLAGTNDNNSSDLKENNSLMSIWSDIQDRSAGKQIRKEDLPLAKKKIAQTLRDIISDAGKMALPRVGPGRLIGTIKTALTDTPVIAKVLPEIQDPSSLLTKEQTLLLKACLLLPFSMGPYESLDDILVSLGVKVIIEPGKPKRTLPPELLPEEIEPWLAMKLRGLYCPDKKVIKLYPENMKDEFDGLRMKELLVSTLAHEVMHAYFDRPQDNKSLPYIISVEEPFAEFGMLVFLYENRLFYRWAEEDVCSKRTVYRYGYALMSQHRAELRDSSNTHTRSDLERYKRRPF
jgi:DNA-directed RNA polymerase specialized sigma24 family protein